MISSRLDAVLSTPAALVVGSIGLIVAVPAGHSGIGSGVTESSR